MDEQILSALKDVRKANHNLNRIKNEYGNNPDLLSLYLPSAEYLVHELKNHLHYLINNEIGEDANINDTADIWIKMEGEQFNHGKGPIGTIGSYLQKLNTANHHAIDVIQSVSETIYEKYLQTSPFYLVATDKGSLNLGLRNPNYNEIIDDLMQQQLNLFGGENQLNIVDEVNQLTKDGFNLLIKVIAAGEQDELFNELKNKHKKEDLMKLFHYAKEMVPSAQSSIDTITFEGKNLDIPSDSLRTNKYTRQSLVKREKSIKQNTEYISGRGWLRAVDLDGYTFNLRPFHFKNKSIDEMKCHLMEDKHHKINIKELLDHFIFLSGFVEYNSNSDPVRLKVDEILTEEMPENDEEDI